MRLAISNIAWQHQDDETVFDLMHTYGFGGLEVAPSKINPAPLVDPHEWASQYRTVVEGRSLQVVGIQSALFGQPQLRLFESESIRHQMQDYLTAMIEICSDLGGRVLVFGSPKNRQKGALSQTEADGIAVPYFRELGDIAQQHQIVIGLEPNATAYGADYMTNMDETLDVVRQVNHPNVQIHADLGVMQLNNENIRQSLEKARTSICHFHISEPMLAPLKISQAHREAARVLNDMGYDKWVSIEMNGGAASDVVAIEQALALVAEVYQ